MKSVNFHNDVKLDENDYREIIKESLKETF